MLLETLFDNLQSDEAILFVDAMPDRSRARRKLLSSVEEVLQWAKSTSSRGREAYFGPVPRSKDDEKALGPIKVLWADLDRGDYASDEEFLAARRAVAAPASFEVWSGHGFHCYWRLKEPVSPETARSIMKAIWKAQGSKPGGRTYYPTCVLRVPGTVNHKGDPPVAVELRAARELVYDPEDLHKLAQLKPVVAQRMWTGSTRGFKSRSERDFNVVSEMVNAGVSEDTIRTLMALMPVGDRVREEGGDQYLTRTLESVRKRPRRPPRTVVVKQGATYVQHSKGEAQIATFAFEPLKLLKASDSEQMEDYYLGNVEAFGYHWDSVVLPQSAFESVRTLSKYTTKAAWTWMGTDADLKRLSAELMASLVAQGMPHAKCTCTLGRHDEYWVAPDGTLDRDTLYSMSDAPIVYVDTGREVPRVSYTLPSEEDYRSLVQRVSALLPRINSYECICLILGWFFATPLAPVLRAVGYSFPILNIYGTRGSGKTATLQKVMHPLMGWKLPRAYPCNAKQFVAMALLSGSNAIPIAFTEYRESLSYGRQLEFLNMARMAYDVGYDARGRPDQTTQTYRLSSPFSIDGEDALADPALLERSIVVHLTPSAVAEGTEAYQAFQELSKLPLRDFAGRYIQRSLCEDEKSVAAAMERAIAFIRKVCSVAIPERILRNTAVAFLGLKMYNDHMKEWGGTPLRWAPEILQHQLSNVLLESTTGRTRVIADDFVEDLVAYVERDPGISEFFYQYDGASNLLWFSLTSAMGWWVQKRRREGRTKLELRAMRKQLLELSYIKPERILTSNNGKQRRCYGLDITAAHREGLDVPSSLGIASVSILGALENENEEAEWNTQ